MFGTLNYSKEMTGLGGKKHYPVLFHHQSVVNLHL